MKRSYRFNLDFEENLLFPGSGKKLENFAADFEYVFFFINQEAQARLATKITYPKDYLDYLESLSLSSVLIDQQTKTDQTINWWGDAAGLSTSQLKQLSSKETALNLAQNLEQGHSAFTMIEEISQISAHIKKFGFKKWALRSPYSLSGRDIRFIDVNGPAEEVLKWAEKKLTLTRLILVPWLERVLDMGSFVEIKNNDSWSVKTHLNVVDARGKFNGCMVGEDLPKLAWRLTGIDLNILIGKLQDCIPKIVEHYLQLGAHSSFGIDSFIYKEDGEYKLFCPCEINYRKTMGLMSHALKRFLPMGGVGQWMIFPTDKIQVSWENFAELTELLGKQLYEKDKKLGIMPTSPVSLRFISLFMAGSDYNDLLSKKSWLTNFLRYRNLPSK